MDKQSLLIRADATITMGTGHVMRCISIAQAWQDAGGNVEIAMATTTSAIECRLQAERIRINRLNVDPGSCADARETALLARNLGADWVVVDGYQFGAEFQNALKQAALKVLFIDDNRHCEHYSADIVLNQNAHASESHYARRDVSTRVLLGPRYALLRREFSGWRAWKREIPNVARRILLTMGGSDPENATEQVLAPLLTADMPGVEIMVVVGGSNPHRDRIQSMIRRGAMDARMQTDVARLDELMAWSDMAVSAAGSTAWELCCLGVPSILIALAENQSSVARYMNGVGAAIHLERRESLSEPTFLSVVRELANSLVSRRKMSEKGRELVDGRGASRVCSQMNFEILLRGANESDSRLLWEWANDSVARAMSFSTEPIPWQSHMSWFRSLLADPNSVIYIATNQFAEPMGQVRFRINAGRSVISISVAPMFRGQGLSLPIMIAGVREFFRTSEIGVIDAYVKPENEPSIRLFARGGFRREQDVVINGNRAAHFVVERAQFVE